MHALTLTRPDDWHLHLRDGAAMADVLPHTARQFAQEERGGFMEDSLCRMPRLAEAAREVLAEHPALLAELDGLLERLAARDSGGEVWRQAGHDFEAFASRLLAHERNENAVVQEGYNEDLGFGD